MDFLAQEDFTACTDQRTDMNRGPNQDHRLQHLFESHCNISTQSIQVMNYEKRIRDEHGNVIGYGAEESIDPVTGLVKSKKGRKGGQKGHDSDSDYSYYSEVSEGGTKYQKRQLRIRDKNGKVIGHGKSENYDPDSKLKKGKGKHGGADGDGSDYSFFSEVSAGGTRRRKRRMRVRDESGKIIGYRKAEDYTSSSGTEVSDGQGGRIKVKTTNKKKGKGVASDVSEATTASSVLREKMKNMTEEEKKAYLENRAKRVQEREQRRKEKQVQRELRKKALESDSEYSVDSQGKVVKKSQKVVETLDVIRDKDGNILKKVVKTSDGKVWEYEYDKHGNVIGKREVTQQGEVLLDVVRDKDGRILKQYVKTKDGKVWEYEYDKDGNVIGKREITADDGDYFEVDEHGNLRLKPGRRKIDLSKLSREDLLKLGIDPNLSSAQIMKLLMEKFGQDLEVTSLGRKIGTKNIADYGSDVDSDALADDPDLDLDSCQFSDPCMQ
ncbi:hypothetical protein Ciccas_010384 [Cichlidogyrus casuarinus]|uniref:Teneurin-like YD-shell domain-containing protein n=1 Tax=Cichlidogyrus casuarinus TaxID=1844966 RepID=A0ABD2PUA0_9PLAT